MSCSIDYDGLPPERKRLVDLYMERFGTSPMVAFLATESGYVPERSEAMPEPGREETVRDDAD